MKSIFKFSNFQIVELSNCRIVIFLFALLFLTSSAQAQQRFISKGKIEFEKKISIHKMLEASLDPDDSWSANWVANMKKNAPAQKNFYFDLLFNGDKTLYKPGREDQTTQRLSEWVTGPANENIVATDLASGTNYSNKAVFGTNYTIQDSIRKIKWQLTSDTRTIAGFECRKATGIIMDSVYVFAFYTDQILTTGGPESFTGLPGMILGVAIPRLNTTWFATKLELQEVTPEQLTVSKSKRNKPMDTKTFSSQLQSSLKDWGKSGQQFIWRIML